MTEIDKFIEKLNAKFPAVNDWDSVFSYTTGKRFYKIVTKDKRNSGTRCSAYGFVDIETGDLYKAATWNAPACHIRGNINDETGLDACEQYSVKYLR